MAFGVRGKTIPPGGMAREIIVPRDPARGPLTAVRGILIQTSLTGLRDLGVFEDYRAHIDPAALETITANIGPSWLPLDVALAHYAACDSLDLSPEQLEQIGSRAGNRLQGGMLQLLAKTARQAGFTPWTALGAYARMGDRIFQGSSAQYVKVGPKDVDLEIEGNLLFRSSYFQRAFVAATRAAFLALGCRVTHVRVVRVEAGGAQAVTRISWV
jgi:hypothetical protein